MGCANSSPLVNGGGPGGLVDSAKNVVNDAMSSGENAMNEMGENISESVGQIKETMVETMNGVATSIGDVINDGMTKIPLTDAMDSTTHLFEENMENMKNDMMNKAQSIEQETDKIADELIKDTEDVIRDAETGIVDMKTGALEKVDSLKSDLMDGLALSSPTHSIDTIKPAKPEQEIERLLNENDEQEQPDAIIDELENLKIEDTPLAPEESSTDEPKVDDQPFEEPPAVKPEDELVVEDIKDETHTEKQFEKRLQKSHAVEEIDPAIDPAIEPLAGVSDHTRSVASVAQLVDAQDDLEDTKENSDGITAKPAVKMNNSSEELPSGREGSTESAFGGSSEESTAETASEGEDKINEEPETEKDWETLQNLYLQNQLQFVKAESEESVLGDEEDLNEINLSKMYRVKSSDTKPALVKVSSSAEDVLDVVEDPSSLEDPTTEDVVLDPSKVEDPTTKDVID